MRDAVICEPVRTAVGRYGGALAGVSASELAAAVVAELLRRTGVAGADIDEVVLGQCNPNGEAPAIGRVTALDAGLPVSVSGLQLDRRCGSGLQAVCTAAMQVQTGIADVVIAGGTESMSAVEHYMNGIRFPGRTESVVLHDRLARARTTAGGKHHPVPGGMLETAENLRREYAISRGDQDELAVRSHRRAAAAQSSGVFAEEIVPITTKNPRGEQVTVNADEHVRADTSAASLARLAPVLRRQDPEATVTAGNSSGQNDGAAACLVTTRETAERLGLTPYARLVTWATAGVEPARMGIGPVPATARALKRAGLALADMDLIEINEAFAAQVLAVTREWGLGAADWDRVNVHGSGISLGHPVGATGARILATMLRELRRREGRYALETMCIGGGQGLTAIFERVA
ncbi:acetyl-CoA C-acetyltransferase [Streptomyces sp. SAI-133]|jgi:acetyl-CoA C-acetyltransferase|uniref:acetyl-CoA C-acetyltransferase n=1 Tax=unclassified Streptomyces TaxID=2593676 RepID=UPI00247332B4|nr:MULTISPECIES: acetyl-CoA C-acetyltransferase [unclassified Streptomyces]MDH6554403.1 acetyl-CoA C-acetyltransferase [Streptomyces sp. SAI-041]MDH6581598.1 acetyl-CoA C-acetyltransferase [Streptomyces sp. SAI-133]